MPSQLGVGDIRAALVERRFPGDHHLEPAGGPAAHARTSSGLCAPRSAMRCGC